MLSLCPLLREISWQRQNSVTSSLASLIEKGILSSLSRQNGGGVGVLVRWLSLNHGFFFKTIWFLASGTMTEAMALGGESLVEGGWKFEIQPSSRGDDAGIGLGVRETSSSCVAADLALKREIGVLGGDGGWEAPLRGGPLVLPSGHESRFSHLCVGGEGSVDVDGLISGFVVTALSISEADDGGRGMVATRVSFLTPLAIGLVWVWFGSARVSLE